MAKGTVSRWEAGRGFGFIANDDGTSIFAHINNLNPRVEPEVGQRVSFNVVMDDRKGKQRADDVRFI